jgi:hypothetical protein
MKLTFALLAGLSVAASAVRTSPPAAPASPDSTTPAAEPGKVEPYVLKKRSTFSLTEDFRPPFWPIGMKKRAEPVAAPLKNATPSKVYKEPILKADYFTVTSIVLTGKPSATLNGRSYLQGDVVSVAFEGHRINLLVLAVFDGGIKLAQGENVFVVPLRRQEIQPGQTSAPETINNQPRVLELDAPAAGKKTK